MHGTYDPPGHKVRTDHHFGTGKQGPRTGTNTVNNTGGSPANVKTQEPIAGPTSPGPPESMRKALAKKSGASQTGKGPGLPNRNTTAAGSR